MTFKMIGETPSGEVITGLVEKKEEHWVLKAILNVEFIDANGNRQDLNYKGPVSLYVKEDETNGRTV